MFVRIFVHFTAARESQLVSCVLKRVSQELRRSIYMFDPHDIFTFNLLLFHTDLLAFILMVPVMVMSSLSKTPEGSVSLYGTA